MNQRMEVRKKGGSGIREAESDGGKEGWDDILSERREE